jgi:hypothetical protein
MAKPPQRDRKLADQIIQEFHEAGQRGDVEAFKRLLGAYGAHLSRTVKEDLIREFRRNAALLRDSLRGE